MLEILLKGFTLGLTLGTTCLVTCTPIYLPYLISEDRRLGKSFLTILEISAGRFFSYLAFGAVAGYTGAQISSVNRSLFTAIAYILLSVYLVLSAFRAHRHERRCHVPKIAGITKSAFFLGVLTGINFCPSFLIAVSNAIDLGGAFSGMLLFFGFFLGTSLYLFPLAFLGQISRVKRMKMLAQIASILVAAYFIYSGTARLYHYFEEKRLEAIPARIVEAFHPRIPLVVLSSADNFSYFSAVGDSANTYHPLPVPVFIYQTSLIDTLGVENHVLLIDSELLQNKSTEQNLEKYDYFLVENNYPISKLMRFLKFYTFKTRKSMHFEFRTEVSS